MPTAELSSVTAHAADATMPAMPPSGSRAAMPPSPAFFVNETQTASRKSNKSIFIVLAVLAVAATGVLVYFFLLRPTKEAGLLPDHFGLFVRNKDALNELRRGDFHDVMQGRDSIMGDSSLPRVDAKPTLILYAEGQDIPVSDLKLLQLDSMDASGKVSYWNYQVAPVDGQPNMKQLRVAGGLPVGKYAFALLNGYMEDGNHKFWPFQIKDDAPVPSDTPQVTMIPSKPKPAPTPTPASQPSPTTPRPASPPPQTSAGLAYCTDNNVVLRSAPNLNGPKIGKLSKGQRLYILEFSSNYDTWRGVTANWAYVQPENSATRGWVFTYFIKQ